MLLWPPHCSAIYLSSRIGTELDYAFYLVFLAGLNSDVAEKLSHCVENCHTIKMVGDATRKDLSIT